MGYTTPLKYKTAGKKRSRANVPHGDPGPETKVFWPINSSNDTADDLNFATFRIHPLNFGTTDQQINAYGNCYPYRMISLQWPAQGSSIHQRIGSSINAKILRLKGVIDVFPTLPAPLRIRVYYVYYKNHANLASNVVTYFKNYTTGFTAANADPTTERLKAHDNYYHGCWKDLWLNEPEFFKTKIMEFYIKPVTGMEIPGQPITGQMPETSISSPGMTDFTASKIFLVPNIKHELVNCIPVDKTIYLNQSVNCLQDSHFLYFEVDDCASFRPMNGEEFGQIDVPNLGSIATPASPLEITRIINLTDISINLKFKTFYYYTDD